MRDAIMFKAGLVSVTFRELSPRQIVDMVVSAGLAGIEWGGDVHVPHGELNTAHRVADMTLSAGLETAAYGSYYRAAASEGAGITFASVLETAIALDTRLIRVWAGNSGSTDTDAATRVKVVDDLRRIGEMAGTHGIAIACEYHTHTLTDTSDSAVQLMQATGHDNVGLYWQPPSAISRDDCTESLRAALPYLRNLHVFQQAFANGKLDRRPLSEGTDLWREYLLLARTAGGDRWAMLEFVRDDTPEQFLDDAATLNDLIR